MNKIINSILDTDLYKFTMQNFVIQHYPNTDAVYEFKNRNPLMKFNERSVEEISRQVRLMSELKLTQKEYDWLTENLPFMPVTYFQYLQNYKFNPEQISTYLNKGELSVRIEGKWRDTILWEVPLMAIISEVYFKEVQTNWNMNFQIAKAENKGRYLSDNSCNFADFGTRRRRNYETQDVVVKTLKDFYTCQGTSNPHFAMKYNLKPIGTCAHEAIGGVAALDSMNRPNKVFMEKWTETYKGRLGIMLPDTFTTNSFLHDFDVEKAKLWDGVRHDSGCPFEFTDKIVNHYSKLGINPKTKTIVFSDSINTQNAIEIKQYCDGKINCSFGIGTFFTNDFSNIPLNMVIKLTKVDNVPVVKLSDEPNKENGDLDMIGIMKYIHNK